VLGSVVHRLRGVGFCILMLTSISTQVCGGEDGEGEYD
jgi:hypothetical protein